jgi:antitoxin component YwqK of YwqJK toxin-antitoxin module
MTEQVNQRDSKGEGHGRWEHYYKNGALMWRGHYLHGKEHRLREWYQPDGTLFSKTYFLTIK